MMKLKLNAMIALAMMSLPPTPTAYSSELHKVEQRRPNKPNEPIPVHQPVINNAFTGRARNRVQRRASRKFK